MVDLGQAWIDYHWRNADPGELGRDADRQADLAEDDFKQAGKKLGDATSEGMEERLEAHGPEFAKAVERGLKRRSIKVTSEIDKGGNTGRRWVTEIFDEIKDVVDHEGRPGGVLSKIGRGIGDTIATGIGAAFNVSGRSPLILLLIPVFGAIAALIGGIVEALQPALAILAALPSGLAGLAIQAATLFVAFNGVGEAIKNAFAAKNTKELKEALKDLTPSAQKFVKALLPLEGFFTRLKKKVQEAFFAGLGTKFMKDLKPLLDLTEKEMPGVAKVLGETFATILSAFKDPAVVKFFTNLSKGSKEWLKGFGPNFRDFLIGLFTFMDAILPFLQKLGKILNEQFFGDFGKFLEDTGKDPGFKEWLDESLVVLQDVFEFLGAIVRFVDTFINSINDAEGKSFLDSMTESLNKLSDFLESDEGKKSIDGLVHSIEMLLFVFDQLIHNILLIFFLFEEIGEFFNTTFPNATLAGVERVKEAWNRMIAALTIEWNRFTSDVAKAWEWLKAGWNRFTADLAFAWNDFISDAKIAWGSLPTAVAFALSWLLTKWEEFRLGVALIIEFVKGKFRSIKDTIDGIFANPGAWLRQKGRDLVQGLIDGIIDKLGPLREAAKVLSWVLAGAIPGSPAKYGPFSGTGAPELRGQRIIKDLVAGISSGTPTLRTASMNAVSNIIFGAGSVVANFNGQLPTNGQAMSLGSSLGSGISGQLAARDTRLAVRML